MEERDERLARNEALFRDVNEHIARQGLQWGSAEPDQNEYLCECSRRDCTALVSMTQREYEQVRRHGKRFFVLPGHEELEVESVVGIEEGYLVVEKHGAAGALVDSLDPPER